MTHRAVRREWAVLAALGVFLLASMIISAGIGAAHVAPVDVMRTVWGHLSGHSAVPTTTDVIVWNLRLPRIMLALLVGSSLGVAGALMQALFHNPMADPYIVGVSSGAAVGAVLAIAIGVQQTVFGVNSLSLFAFVGGVAVTFLVYVLARRAGRVPVGTLLLTGIAVGGVMQSATAFLLLQREQSEMREVLGWLMGSLANRDWQHVQALLPYTVIGVAAAFVWRRDLNVLALGDETAHYLGIHTERAKTILLLVASLLAAAAVAVSGVIAFVGLIVPHLVRLLLGPNHRVLIPACLLCGGTLLVWADVLARSIVPGGEVPIGIVTGVLGCFFFLYLLHRRETRAF